ncbi:MAG: hypothetical protein OXG72_15810 [Acidobacteria bacterium]|nr:hypothetical protein [Acidobacteriota bacterium]
MPDTTGRRCDHCGASGETTRLRLRHACHACCRRMRDDQLYFRIPKAFTFKGLRTQASGLRWFLEAAYRSAAGRTPAARERGRLCSLKLAASVWIDQWYVLSSTGWRR